MAKTSADVAHESARHLRGAEKVAALLLAMGKPAAERLLPYFEASELRQISVAAAELGTVSARELEALIEAFAAEFGAGLSLLLSAREMKDMLTGAIPPEAAVEKPGEAEPASDQAIWIQIAQLSDEVLADYLAGERPQTVALILSRLEPQKAARMITALPEMIRDEAMRRMLTSKPPTEAAIEAVAATLREDLLLKPVQRKTPDPHERLAKIINNLDPQAMEGVMRSLGDTRPQSAETLRGMLFTFDDIPAMSPRARTVLFDNVPSEQLVLALKGMEEVFNETVLTALPARTRRVVESELARKEPALERDVMVARREVVDLALDMGARGELELKPASEDSAGLVIA